LNPEPSIHINPSILLTVDVEDWFQVENFKPYIPFSSWPERELRVERNVHRLLDLFDSVKTTIKPSSLPASQPQAEGRPNATFFMLGWLAERLPHLVREIHARGHEVASHGYNHQLPGQLSDQDLKQDLVDSKRRLEELIGAPVTGYRAPSFDISDDTLKIIEDSGYSYDSSYNSFALHGRYGTISLNGNKKMGIALQMADNFFELPVSNLEFDHPISYQLSTINSGRNAKKRFVLPWGGGGYFRLIPGALFRRGVKSILARQNAYLFYMHPWEIDPDQPRVNEAGASARFKHYTNLARIESGLAIMIEYFSHCNFTTCGEYLEIVKKNKNQ
jgi:polysaccharide deacetylase family protein (PEP-CTERM system associated)